MSTFNPSDTNERNYVGFWWDYEGADCARRVHSIVSLLRTEQWYISERYRRAMEMYENVKCNYAASNFDAGWQFASWKSIDGPYGLNIAESIVDTVHAEIISAQTKVQFVSSSGQTLQDSWEVAQRAVALTNFTAGLFDENKVVTVLSPALALDALIFGDGYAEIHIDDDDDRVHACRVFPNNIVFDDIESATGNLSSWYREKFISRETLRRAYIGNDVALSVIAAAPDFQFQVRPRDNFSDMVRVIEAWQPATKRDEGRHVIALENDTLLEEAWTKPYFPFVHLTYKKRPRSMHGKGIPEILIGQQHIVNAFREKVDAQLAGASPFIWVKPGSVIRESELSNLIWRLIESEDRPEPVVFPAVSNDLFQQLQQEQIDAQGAIGVNSMMMKGELPPGISGSGRSMRIYNDTKSKRFMRFARDYEQMHVNLAEIMIDLIDDKAVPGKGYEAKFEERDSLTPINYNDIRLPVNSFKIRPYPVNFLSDTPAGRLSDIEALASAFPQLQPYLPQLLQNPDIEAATSLLSVQETAAQRIAQTLLKTNAMPRDVPPTPYMDIELAVGIFRNFIVDAVSRGVPSERVQKLMDWITMAEAVANQLAQAAAPPPAMPQMGAPTPDIPLDGGGLPPGMPGIM